MKFHQNSVQDSLQLTEICPSQRGEFFKAYNILRDQWQTIEIDQIGSITQETEFSQMAELLYIYI